MKIAVLIPCYNEARTIGKVIRDFRKELPEAHIYVYDNNSTDESMRVAQTEGARVERIKRQGKGYVIRKMFNAVDADIYVMVDGDDTYDASAVHALIKPVSAEEADMVIGRRVFEKPVAMRGINKIGNAFFSNLLSFCFLENVKDVLSGYRAMSREVAHNIPIIRHEFQVEMEMTVQCLYRGFRIKEIPVGYRERPHGSFSKLHPIRDGNLIMLTLLSLIRDLRPLEFFGFIATMLLVSVLCYGLYVYLAPRMATLLDTVVIISGAIIAFLFFMIGLFLHTINRRFIELILLFKKDNGKDASQAL